jgi:hypothetical protein
MSGVLETTAAQREAAAQRELSAREVKANMTSGGNAAYHNFK